MPIFPDNSFGMECGGAIEVQAIKVRMKAGFIPPSTCVLIGAGGRIIVIVLILGAERLASVFT